MARALLLGLLLALGCGGEEPVEELGSAELAIVNGAADPGHAAAGLLYIGGAPACTATLVGPSTVLTAAHCVTDDKKAPFALLGPLSFALSPAGARSPVVSATVHPGFSHTGNTWIADLALLRLGAARGGVLLPRLAQGAPVLGERLTLVGYGYTADGESASFGVKRKARNTVGKLQPHLITFYGASGASGSLCFGDSGGPSFATRGGVEELVGVHSYGDGACGEVEHDQRVDTYRAWIIAEGRGDVSASGGAAQVAPGSPDVPLGLDGEAAGIEGDALAGAGCSLGRSGSVAGPGASAGIGLPLVLLLLGRVFRRPARLLRRA